MEIIKEMLKGTKAEVKDVKINMDIDAPQRAALSPTLLALFINVLLTALYGDNVCYAFVYDLVISYQG